MDVINGVPLSKISHTCNSSLCADGEDYTCSYTNKTFLRLNCFLCDPLLKTVLLLNKHCTASRSSRLERCHSPQGRSIYNICPNSDPGDGDTAIHFAPCSRSHETCDPDSCYIHGNACRKPANTIMIGRPFTGRIQAS